MSGNREHLGRRGSCLLSLRLHWPSKYLGTCGTRWSLSFAKCPAQSPHTDSHVYLCLILKIGWRHLCVAGWFLCGHFCPGLGAWSVMGNILEGRQSVGLELESVPVRLPPAHVTKSHVEAVLHQPNVLSVVCRFVFLSKAFVCVSETVRDQSSKYSCGREKYTFLKLKQT